MSNVEKIQYNLVNILENLKNSQYPATTTTAARTIFTKFHNTNETTSDDVNNNKNNNNNTNYYNNNNNNSNSSSSSSNNSNKPMNLMINNSKFVLQHHSKSEQREQHGAVRSEEFNKPKQSLSSASSSSSGSPSIDVENDTEEDDDSSSIIGVNKFVSSASSTATSNSIIIPQIQYPNPLIQRISGINMELTAASVPTGFPLNYQQMYANNAALYGTPVMFSGALHASYMAGLPLHAAMSPNESYLKAIQAAACGLYNPTVLAPTNLVACKPPPPALQQSHQSPNNMHNPNTTAGSMIALAPSVNTIVGINNSPQYSPKLDQINDSKKDYHNMPPSSSVATTTNSLSMQQSASSTAASSAALTTPTRLTPKGTYLQEKMLNERVTGAETVAASNTTTQHDTHFKVPNGKEGSLKHRILRPLSNESSESCKTPTMRTYSSPCNFKKGTYIELANGSLRRVEDMRTEDFIQCAERSPHHQLAESTVVKINTSLPTTVVITFSYDRNRSKVDMEVPHDHPFFVYGQGWASCSPEISLKAYGLKCQRLQVGDICISLTSRETPSPKPMQTNENLSHQKRNLYAQSASSSSSASGVPSPNSKSPLLPSPLSSAAAQDMTTSYVQHIPQQHAFTSPLLNSGNPHHLTSHLKHSQHHHQAYAEMSKLMSQYAYAKGLPQITHEQLKEVVMDANILSPELMNTFYQQQIFHLAQQQQHQQHQFQERLRQNDLHAQRSPTIHQSPSTPTDLEPSQHHHQQPTQTQPLDVSMSRKRRWSAPENMFDDDDAETQPPRNLNVSSSSPHTARA